MDDVQSFLAFMCRTRALGYLSKKQMCMFVRTYIKSFAMDLVTDKLVSSFDIITIFLDVIKAFSADFWNCVYTSGPKISTSAHLNSPFPYKINNPKNLTTTGKIHIFSNPILLQLYSKYASYTIT